MLGYGGTKYVARRVNRARQGNPTSLSDVGLAVWKVVLPPLYVLDVAANALLPSILWGEIGTISAKLGRTKAKHGGEIPWWHPFAKAVDEALLEPIDPNHSLDAAKNEDVI